jgi:hypothetical protein
MQVEAAVKLDELLRPIDIPNEMAKAKRPEPDPGLLLSSV